jgi:hypothetical protein
MTSVIHERDALGREEGPVTELGPDQRAEGWTTTPYDLPTSEPANVCWM